MTDENEEWFKQNRKVLEELFDENTSFVIYNKKIIAAGPSGKNEIDLVKYVVDTLGTNEEPYFIARFKQQVSFSPTTFSYSQQDSD